MADSVKCSLCLEQYQPQQREPLMLPCGHTFCRSCMAEGKTTGRLRCPTCSRDLSLVEVQYLPVNFQVLDLSATYTKLQHESCSEHGDELRYWCRVCARSLCSLCLYGDHPQGHQVLHSNTFLHEKKQLLKDQVTELRDFIEDTKIDINYNLRRFYHKMTKLCQFETDVTAFLGDILSVKSVESILAFEEMFKGLQEEKLGSFSSDVSKDVAGVGVGGVVPKVRGSGEEHGGDGAGDGEEQAAGDGGGGGEEHERDDGEETDEADAEVDQHQQQLQKPASGSSHRLVDTRHARLDYQDGRLLLHALSQRMDTRLSLKLPSEVFLELSVGGRCLGCVYIHLWTNLRSAQHFLALCLGTLGPSHVGAFFRNVSDKNKGRETIWCTEYRLKNGEKCDRVLMTDLEWGGEHSLVPREGLVVQYTSSVDNYGFGICTSAKEDASFSGPFGEVSSGMDVVRAAVSYDPVTHVTITDCGVIIPDLTP